MSATASTYYDDRPQFGDMVQTKFPEAITDIQEGAKCFAIGRFTASVFHLMRVMEYATQYLGKKLNVNLAGEKNWHNILDEVERQLKGCPLRILTKRESAIGYQKLQHTFEW